MKGFIASVTLLSSILLIIFLCGLHLTKTVTALTEFTVVIEKALDEENYKKALKLTETFEKRLKSEAEYLYYCSDRAPIDNAITECARMKSYIKAEDKSESSSALSGIRATLKKALEKSIIFK